MKRCSYCGAEYPDDATECAVDKTPFEEASPEAVPYTRPTFAIFSEYKIPRPLCIVSYFFFAEGVWTLIEGLSTAVSSPSIIMAFMFLEGIVCICISRGLRRCSAGWRICALVLLWWYFAVFAYLMGRTVLAYIGSYGQAHNALGAFFSSSFFIVHCVYFVLEAWAFLVLIRPDIRELF